MANCRDRGLAPGFDPHRLAAMNLNTEMHPALQTNMSARQYVCQTGSADDLYSLHRFSIGSFSSFCYSLLHVSMVSLGTHSHIRTVT